MMFFVLIMIVALALYLLFKQSPPTSSRKGKARQSSAYFADLKQLNELRSKKEEQDEKDKRKKITIRIAKESYPIEKILDYVKEHFHQFRYYLLIDTSQADPSHFKSLSQLFLPRIIQCSNDQAVIACVRQLHPLIHFDDQIFSMQHLKAVGQVVQPIDQLFS